MTDIDQQAIDQLAEQKVKDQVAKDQQLWRQLMVVGAQMKALMVNMTAAQMQRALKAFEAKPRGEHVPLLKDSERNLLLALESIVGLRLLLLTSNEATVKKAEKELKKARIQGQENKKAAEETLSALEKAKQEFTQATETKEGE